MRESKWGRKRLVTRGRPITLCENGSMSVSEKLCTYSFPSGGVCRSSVVHVFRVRKDRRKFMEQKQKWNNSQGSCQGQNEINSLNGRCCPSFCGLLGANLSIATTGGVLHSRKFIVLIFVHSLFLVYNFADIQLFYKPCHLRIPVP